MSETIVASGGLGTAVPRDVVENAPIASRLGVDPAWIVQRTGIERRHVVAPGDRLDELAARAGSAALQDAAVDPRDVDLVLVANTSADELTPAAAPLVAAQVGAVNAGAIDVGAACTGFLSGLSLAAAQLESGRAHKVLLIGADILSRYVDPDDRRTAALFGDGAGALLLTPQGPAVGPVVLGAAGDRHLLFATRARHVIEMEGHEVFKHAVARMSEATLQALDAAGLTLADVDLFVYHQANRRILDAVRRRLGAERERIVDCIADFGNTSAASIPIALDHARRDGRLSEGTRVLMGAFGAGFTWGAAVVEWRAA